jgi:hypothetical protein
MPLGSFNSQFTREKVIPGIPFGHLQNITFISNFFDIL